MQNFAHRFRYARVLFQKIQVADIAQQLLFVCCGLPLQVVDAALQQPEKFLLVGIGDRHGGYCLLQLLIGEIIAPEWIGSQHSFAESFLVEMHCRAR